MPKFNLDDTIAAISTPIGGGAIGIVRLSGKDAVLIADRIFKARSGFKLKDLKSFSLSYGLIEKDGKIIDEAIVSLMKSPKSYTRENIIEINCHSGLVALKKVLELVIKEGARLAEPGEFTKRAFLNGRIDLAQAEAVLDIISSKTEDALNIALNQLEGNFSRKINDFKNRLLNVLSNLEVAIDFSEEDIELFNSEKLTEDLNLVLKEISILLESSKFGMVLRAGLKCAICGKPNVGKSSLMNAILKKDRSIVTDIPGTTRDTIEETANIKGIPINFIDTAGIVETTNIIEKEGILRTKDSIKISDLVIFMLDGNSHFSKDDGKIIDEIKNKKVLVVVNKSDLPNKLEMEKVAEFFPAYKIIKLSALRGDNLKGLEDAILELTFEGKAFPDAGNIVVSNLRHKVSLTNAKELIQRAKKAFSDGLSFEFVASDLNEAVESLNEILGESVKDDILDRIFAQFCIGK